MDKNEEAHELTSISVKEVSLVGKPSNQRRWLLLKNEEGIMEKDNKPEDMSETEKTTFLSLLKKFFGFASESKSEPQKQMMVCVMDGKINDQHETETDCTKAGGKWMAEDMVKTTKEVKQMAEKEVKEPEKIPIDIKKSEEYVNLSKEHDSLKAKVELLEKANRRRNLEEIAKSIPGKSEDNLTYLESLADSLPEDKFKIVVDREKLHAKQLKESELFVEKGKTTSKPSSSEAKIMEIAKSIGEKDKIDFFKAMNKAMQANPELYAQYVKETTKRVDEDILKDGEVKL